MYSSYIFISIARGRDKISRTTLIYAKLNNVVALYRKDFL